MGHKHDAQSSYQTTLGWFRLLSKICLCWPGSTRLTSLSDRKGKDRNYIPKERGWLEGKKTEYIVIQNKMNICVHHFIFYLKKKKHWRQKAADTNEHLRDWGTLIREAVCSESAKSGLHLQHYEKATLGTWVICWRSGKRRASLEDRGIFPVWCLCRPPLLWVHHQELQSQGYKCCPKTSWPR